MAALRPLWDGLRGSASLPQPRTESPQGKSVCGGANAEKSHQRRRPSLSHFQLHIGRRVGVIVACPPVIPFHFDGSARLDDNAKLLAIGARYTLADAPVSTVRFNRFSFYFHSGDRR